MTRNAVICLKVSPDSENSSLSEGVEFYIRIDKENIEFFFSKTNWPENLQLALHVVRIQVCSNHDPINKENYLKILQKIIGQER